LGRKGTGTGAKSGVVKIFQCGQPKAGDRGENEVWSLREEGGTESLTEIGQTSPKRPKNKLARKAARKAALNMIEGRPQRKKGQRGRDVKRMGVESEHGGGGNLKGLNRN